jgi:sugar lactone lactonase YvrE
MNDGGCDPDGRFHCGSMAYDQRPHAAKLYRLDADLTVHVVLDGSRVYFNDTATHRISAFDNDPESGLTNRRVFADIPDDGRPDGLTVDSGGGVWSAVSNGRRRAPVQPGRQAGGGAAGPGAQGHRLCLRGERLDELFITTSREGLPEGQDPLAGSLFRARPEVAGLSAREFAG